MCVCVCVYVCVGGWGVDPGGGGVGVCVHIHVAAPIHIVDMQYNGPATAFMIFFLQQAEQEWK